MTVNSRFSGEAFKKILQSNRVKVVLLFAVAFLLSLPLFTAANPFELGASSDDGYISAQTQETNNDAAQLEIDSDSSDSNRPQTIPPFASAEDSRGNLPGDVRDNAPSPSTEDSERSPPAARTQESPEDSAVEANAQFEALEISIAPLTDAVAGLPPVPAGAVGVANTAQLNAAIAAANANNAASPNYIYLTASWSPASAGFTNINAAGLLNGGEGLTIDGRGHRLDHQGSTAGTSLFRVQGGTSARQLTIKNFDFIPATGTGTGNAPVISFSAGSGTASDAVAADSRFWTVNLHNIRGVNSAGNPAIVNRGIIALSDGEVNFSGTNWWHKGQRRIIINARMVNFNGGNTELRLTRTATVSATEGRRTLIVRADPTSAAARDMGVGVTLSDGATVYMNRIVNAGNTAREGPTIRINSGGLADGNVRPAILHLSEGSSLTVFGNMRGVGSGAANNGIISMSGGSGGVSVSGGSELFAHNTRRGAGTSAGTSAFIQNIRGGSFEITGEGSVATFISESQTQARQGTVRFYMDGGVSNQTVSVTDGAELNITNRHIDNTNNNNRASALRFGMGTGNGFYVNNGMVNIYNYGNNTFLNPGTNTNSGWHAGVEFAANNWFFHVTGESDLRITAHRGAAINARGHANGQIRVDQGANLEIMGRTPGVGENDGIIRATGGNVHFNMNNPQFFDFVNTRPGGGRVFSLGGGAGNTFTSTNSDLSVWRRGVNVWDGEPDRHWTLINVRLTGAHLRNVDAANTYPDFREYYDTAPNSRRMESFTRISGNNSQPTINELLDLTNADRHARALVEIPEGRLRDPRPVWANELWADFTHISSQTGASQVISSNSAPLGTLVRSFFEETLYEVETDVMTVDGVLRMTHDDERFLRAGDLYRIDAAWRSTAPNLPRNHVAANIPPAMEFEIVRDVVPPQPVTINDMVVPVYQVDFGGSWELEDAYDDGPLLGTEGIRLYARTGAGAHRVLQGSGEVFDDNTWTFTANPGQLFAGDFVWVTLADTQIPPNRNPLTPTPVRDRTIPEASWFIVSPDGMMPVIVQHFFEGTEHIEYRFVSAQMTHPDPNETRTVNMGPGTSSATHLYFPPQGRLGYIIDRFEVRGPGGTLVETITPGPDGRPPAPFNVSPGNTTVHVHYVLDPEFRRDVLVEFRFADFGGTGAGSWTLQASVPYNLVRTGTFNATGVNRFPNQAITDLHITESLTNADLQALVNALFAEGSDPVTGDIIPPAIDGLPRGFVPCPENHIQLPPQGTGASPQLEFPVAMADLYASRAGTAPNAPQRPIVINYVATLEAVTLDQVVQRCPELAGTPAQLAIFDNLSFNYQLVLSRGVPGGRNVTGGGHEPWQNHRLHVQFDSERAEPPEGSEIVPAWAAYLTHTWHGDAGTSTPGAIRIGTWNGTTGPGGGHADSGTGTTGIPAVAATGNRRVGFDESVTINYVPSTAYIAVTQQVNGAPTGGTTAPSGANATWLNNAILNHHERDFVDALTTQRYLWNSSPTHLASDSAANNTAANAIHTTNWANPLPTDSNPAHNPGRPMENMSRDFDFRIVSQNGFMVTVTNHVDGNGADMERARDFEVVLRDASGNYLAAGRTLMLFVGEYEQGPITINPETLEEEYEMVRVLTPVTIGANGTIPASALPSLLPSESFTIMRVGGMYTVEVIMLPFDGDSGYDVSYFYIRDNEGARSADFPGMTSQRISFNRDYLEVTFESYQERELPLPTGLFIAGGLGTLAASVSLAGAAGAAHFARRRRIEIEAFSYGGEVSHVPSIVASAVGTIRTGLVSVVRNMVRALMMVILRKI